MAEKVIEHIKKRFFKNFDKGEILLAKVQAREEPQKIVKFGLEFSIEIRGRIFGEDNDIDDPVWDSSADFTCSFDVISFGCMSSWEFNNLSCNAFLDEKDKSFLIDYLDKELLKEKYELRGKQLLNYIEQNLKFRL